MRPAPPEIAVAIVDDDQMVRTALRRYLGIAPDITVVGDCASAADALALLGHTHVDVLLMDINMPRMDGVEATRAVLAASPTTRVVMVTSLEDTEVVHAAIDAGATGFLLKTVTPEALVHSVRGVHRGVSVVSGLRLDAVVQPPPVAAADAPALTEREADVLTLLCRGLSNQEIGQQLFLSESSIKGYVTSLMQKLGVTSRLKAVVRAHEWGLDRS